jgi:hypothetical protein
MSASLKKPSYTCLSDTSGGTCDYYMAIKKALMMWIHGFSENVDIST